MRRRHHLRRGRERTNRRHPAIYSHLQDRGWRVDREHLLVLAAAGLAEEAVRKGREIEYEGVSAKVFRPEHIIAITASVGRHKDLARIEQLLEQAEIGSQ